MTMDRAGRLFVAHASLGHVFVFAQNCLFIHLLFSFVLFFFFQAEDGIRDDLVTGVQTCALPIWVRRPPLRRRRHLRSRAYPDASSLLPTVHPARRSEERRVGKECRSRWSPS